MQNDKGRKQQNLGTQMQATYKQFLSKLYENNPITGLIMETKAFQFAKKLNIINFQATDGWLRNWKER